MKVALLTIAVLIGLSNPISGLAQNRLRLSDGKIEFKSEAPLELIKASTSTFLGILDLDKNAFAIAVPIHSFKGFNSGLQREHFNENYMESEKYPKGIFKGRIIDKELDLTKNGYYSVITQGELIIHGVEQKREIPCEILVENGLVTIEANFDVFLDDHKIKIPTIVSKKLSEVIHVNIGASFAKKS